MRVIWCITGVASNMNSLQSVITAFKGNKVVKRLQIQQVRIIRPLYQGFPIRFTWFTFRSTHQTKVLMRIVSQYIKVAMGMINRLRKFFISRNNKFWCAREIRFQSKGFFRLSLCGNDEHILFGTGTPKTNKEAIVFFKENSFISGLLSAQLMYFNMLGVPSVFL